MIFNKGEGEYQNWIVAEGDFTGDSVKECESVLSQGNGYMGLRASVEEPILYYRDLFVAGTFDKPDDDATALPNSPDVVEISIKISGCVPSPFAAVPGTYERTLNLKTGLLRRSFDWVSEEGNTYNLTFLRVVSLKDLHLISSSVTITPKTPGSCETVEIRSGIDGETINANHHMKEISKKSDRTSLSLITQTVESGVYFITSTHHSYFMNASPFIVIPEVTSDGNKQIFENIKFELKYGNEFNLRKTSSVFTSRDKERNDCTPRQLACDAKAHMKTVMSRSFDDIYKESADEWQSRIWDSRDIVIDTSSPSDQLAIRFAVYHLTVMAPVHDNRMNIGAKGLSGPGYKGHAFWDTEVFMLPYFMFEAPHEARSLLEYRYNSLDAARRNAKERSFDGAMFPWEAAWITDGETTPSWAMTGLLEHHITSDIAFAVYYYYMVTGDTDFMEKCGYELIFETAKFWVSRMTLNEKLDRYEILDVIGPDEYKEHVDNNAFTNYMAEHNMALAIEYSDILKRDKPELFAALDEKVGIADSYPKWQDACAKIYLPHENSDGLLPQDDTYLTLPDIAVPECSLSEMIEEARHKAGEIGYTKAQISKQADVVVLYYLLEDLFSVESKKRNFYYYEKRTFHDSSLSLSTYSALAADIGEKATAYKLYERATMIDLTHTFYDSAEGIHSASLGGIWQCTVFGFTGVRRYGKNLRIQPNLPDTWNSVHCFIYWHSQKLEILATHDTLTVKNLTGADKVEFLCGGVLHDIGNSITINYKETKAD